MEAWREELYHHGIKGQKWGVQNGPSYPLSREQRSPTEKRKNGAVSESGKERYGKDGVSSNPNSESHSGNKNFDSSKMSDTTKKSLIKNASEMSNAELQAAINRLQRENQYKQMVAESKVPRPSDKAIPREALGVVKNVTSIASSIANIANKKEVSDGLSAISKIAGGSQNSLDAIQKVQNRKYDRAINEIKKSIDLSNMSDSELNDAVNRMFMERTYDDLVNKSNYVESGKDVVLNYLQLSNAVVGVGSSAVGIASGIKKLTSSGGNEKTKTEEKSVDNKKDNSANKEKNNKK